jgi:tetratricopeptide (TPR) repeat protein
VDDSDVTRIDRGEMAAPHASLAALPAPGITTTTTTPTHIGRFVIVRKLGEGGMGVVYYAFDPKLERPVALKVLRPAMRDDHHSQGEARLLREAQAMARLSHPNVVQVFDTGKYDAAVYLAMEYVAGRDLRAWLATPHPWRDIIGVFLQAGHGLAAAHAAGVIHRDFKPDNVLVGDDGRVRVLDFGLSRPPRGSDGPEAPGEPATPSANVTLTQVGAYIGTPAYMSPEQHLCQPADARSDQFSFCVALYEALYGQRPFSGRSAAEVRLAVFRDLALPVDPRRAPGHLRRALARGLQRRPGDRFPDMAGLLAALAADPARRRRNLALAGLGLGLVAGLSAALGGDTQRCDHGRERVGQVWGESRAEQARTAFVATGLPHAAEIWPKVQAALDAHAVAWAAQRDTFCADTHLRGAASSERLDLRNRCLDTNLGELDALVGALVTADAATVDRGLQLVGGLTPPARCADDNFARERIPPPGDPALADPVARARSHLARAAARREAGRPRESREIASAVRRSSQGLDYPPLHAEALLELGRSEEATADFQIAHDHLAEAYHLALGIAHDAVATDAAIILSLVDLRMNHGPQALSWSEHARSLLQRTDEPADKRVLYLLFRSYVLSHHARKAEAIATASEGLALAEASFGLADPRTARLLAGLGHAHWSNGDPVQALGLFERSQAAYRSAGGPDHPSVASAGINISSIRMSRSEWDAALAAVRPALALMERAYGPDNPNVADCLVNLANILTARGELREALAASERAAQIYARVHGPLHGTAINLTLEIGVLQALLGRPEAALASLHRGLALRGQAAYKTPAGLAGIHILLADILTDERRHKLAELEYGTALGLGAEPPPEIRRAALRGRAQLARQQGDPTTAITLARQALAIPDPAITSTRDDQTRRDHNRAPLLHELGEALLADAQVDAALLACKEALTLADLTYGPGAVLTLRARLCLGRVHLARDERGAAQELLSLAAAQAERSGVAPALRGATRAALADALADPERAATLRRLAAADFLAAGPAFALSASAP